MVQEVVSISAKREPSAFAQPPQTKGTGHAHVHAVKPRPCKRITSGIAEDARSGFGKGGVIQQALSARYRHRIRENSLVRIHDVGAIIEELPLSRHRSGSAVHGVWQSRSV